MYITNDIHKVPHVLDVRTAAAVSAVGVSFTCPIDKRRILFQLRIDYVATATVGTRLITLAKQRKDGANISLYVSGRNITAGITESYEIGPGTGQSATLVFTQQYPLNLEPEWQIFIDDTANIDNADTVAWRIEYVEIPLT